MRLPRILFVFIAPLIVACNCWQFIQLSHQNTDQTIRYWSLIWLDSGLPEDDMIDLTPNVVLDRVETDILASADPAENIRTALQLIIDTPEHRLWETEGMTIDEVRVDGSAATVRLSGHINFIGGLVAYGAEVQLVLTVFEQADIDTLLLTFDGDNFANLHIDHESQRKPEDFVYTRADYYDAFFTNP